MKKIITLICFCLPFFALFVIVGSESACQKASTNCPCTITVKDSLGNAESGAFVRLYAPHSTAGALGLTNGAGIIDFNFSLPAVYSIEAYKALGPNDTLKSFNNPVIQLQVGQSVSTTVTIQR